MEAKPWYQSKTLWGGMVAFGASLAGAFGLSIGAAEQEQLVNGLVAVGGLAGFGLTVWGRLSANKKITG